jgi:PAS domain S-box-containing protein
MTDDKLNPSVLGQFLLMQSHIINLPDKKSIFSFVCKGLLDIPGVNAVQFYENSLPKQDQAPLTVCYQVTLGKSNFGDLIVTYSDKVLYKPYEVYLKNFIFIIGVILEERLLRQLNEQHQSELEQKILERTQELTIEKDNLIESQRRFTDMMKNVRLLSVMLDIKGTILFCNDYLLQLTGYVLEEIQGRNWFEVFVEESSIDQVKHDFQSTLKGAEFANNFENDILTKSGHKLVVSWNNTVLFDRNKAVIGTASIGENITQRKQAEFELKEKTEEIEAQNEEYLQLNEELHRSKAKVEENEHVLKIRNEEYKSINSKLKATIQQKAELENRLQFALTTNHIGAWDLDLIDHTAIHTLEHNKIFGYDSLIPDWSYELFLEHVIESDRQKVDAKFKQSIQQHTELNFECRIKRKDGAIRWICVSGQHQSNKEGVCNRIVGIVQDITDRKQVEELLLIAKEKAEENEELIQRQYQELLATEEEIRSNNEELHITSEALQKSNEALLLAKEKAEESEEIIHQQYKELLTTEEEIRSNNEELYITTEALQKSNTALLIAKEKAEESDRLKTAFLQNMSHEIRTPMNAIMGFSALMSENYNDQYKLEKFAAIINLRCNDLLDIINDILDIAKIESGQLSVTIEECNLFELFNELTTFFTEHKKQLGKEHISLTLNVPAEMSDCIIITDKVKIKQIFINLIGNAFKFTESGSIEGGCKYDEHHNLIFYVSDTGIGIPHDKQAFVFERFAQVNHGKDKLVQGTGLGLSIVKGLINLLGGEIVLKSELYKGSTFTFTISYKTNNTVQQKAAERNVLPKYSFQNKTILIIEDDYYNAEYLLEILSNLGLNILQAKNGNSAIKIAVESEIDIVLMDIRLPDMNGYDVTAEIIKFKPLLKIIAQTAYASNDEKQKAIKAGCIDYISKPTKKNELLTMLNKYLY